MILAIEFIGTLYWLSYSDDKYDSPLDAINLEFYVKNNETTIQQVLTFPDFDIWGNLNISMISRMLIITPMVEEFVFRGLLFSTVLNR